MKLPVVALESTIITHGMPYPHNLQTALEVEQVIKDNGSTPATIAILEGKICIGLLEKQFEQLANGRKDAVKTSRRDLPHVISQKQNGGTTVSATMLAAHMADIAIFVTGGVGGVHRGAETSFDISADLTELGRTPVTVVSSGVKSILDIAKTLEYLETQGVCVATFGPTKDFPAFFTPKSGFQAPYNVTSAKTAAQLIESNRSLNIGGGMLIAVPIPDEHAAEGARVEEAINIAIKEAKEKSIVGREVTPYILHRVNEITQGASLLANMALVKNNAKIGSQIAVELSTLQKQNRNGDSGQKKKTANHFISKAQTETTDRSSDKDGRLVVIGGTNVDFTARFNAQHCEPNGATYPGTVEASFGGVGRNIADCLIRLGMSPLFLSAVGRDAYGALFREQCKHMDLSRVLEPENAHTATYCALLKDTGELVYGIGDFDIHQQISPDYISNHIEDLCTAPMVCIDGNVSSEAIDYVTDVCKNNHVPVWFEPTDVNHVRKVFASEAWRRLTYTSPNLNELRMFSALVQGKHVHIKRASSVDGNRDDTLEEALTLVKPVLDHVPVVMVTLGQHGVLLCCNTCTLNQDSELLHSAHKTKFADLGHPSEAGIGALHFLADVPGYPNDAIQSVSGGGDCLAAATIVGILQGLPTLHCIQAGLLAARYSLQSSAAIPDTISPSVMTEAVEITTWPEPFTMHALSQN